MRKMILAGVAAVAIGGLVAGSAATLGWAQPVPGPAVPGDTITNAGPPMAPGPMGPPWMRWMAWMHGHPHGAMEGPFGGPRTFALFYHPDDRQLAAPDVQKIAEAFLLWNGNRTWKVTDVAAGPAGKIGFAFATADGGVIARFTMDSKTGRIERVG